MIDVPVTRGELEKSRRWDREIKEQGRGIAGGRGYFQGHGWIGWLGERALETALRERGIPVVRNGDVDGKPDLEVVGRSVGVKTTQKRQLAIVPRPHVDQRWDWFFFCGWRDSDRCVELRGALTPEAFRARARLFEVGDEPWVRFPCYGVTLDELVPAERWLALATLAADAERRSSSSILPSAAA